MAECSSGQPSDPPRIAINGRYLDEVQTRVEYGRDVRWAGFARAPTENHRAIVTDEAITLRLPMLTALQLYVDGTLPVDRRVPVSLEVGGHSLGEFFVEWLRCADRHYAGEPMYLRLRAAGDLKTGLPADSTSPPMELPPSPP